jgi:hypothetical protein
VRLGHPGAVLITATLHARRRDDLRRIVFDVSRTPRGVRIVTENPTRARDASVDLTVLAPPGMRLVITNGVGDTRCEGRPEGGWVFSVGVGDLTLAMPPDVGAIVTLEVGVGTIASDFPVTGRTTATSMEGTIGSGIGGSIVATVGAGTIRLTAR